MKTLYISDLDGTLLNRSAELSVYTKTTVNSLIAGGLNFTVASARALNSAVRILAGMNLSFPAALMNGVLIYDIARQNYEQIHKFAPESVKALVSAFRETDMTAFMYELKDGEFITHHETLEQQPMRDFVEERIARYRNAFNHTESFESISPENIIFFTLLDTLERIGPVSEAAARIPGISAEMYRDVYNEGLWYLEICHEKASKKNAVTYLRERYGFDRVVGFGDNLNDLPMFEACDIRVAVANAKREIIDAADLVCGANDEDGVAKWLVENT